jgi:hypothetical protein
VTDTTFGFFRRAKGAKLDGTRQRRGADPERQILPRVRGPSQKILGRSGGPKVLLAAPVVRPWGEAGYASVEDVATGRAIPGPNPTADLAGVGKGHSLRPARLRRPQIRRSLTLGAAAFAFAGVAAACTPVAAPPGPSASDLYRLRMCESGGNYAINTGNGYYGAYQFAVGTWNSLGFPGYPNQAAPATQDAAVAKLWRESGWSSWPGCAASLGL